MYNADPYRRLDGYSRENPGILTAAGRGVLRGLDEIGDLFLPDDWFEVEAPRAEGVAGFIESLTQFGTGFLIPGAGSIGLLSKIPAAARMLKASSFLRGTIQGAVADFTAFDGHEERLSDLLAQSNNPVFNNAVTQFLAADEEDSEVMGRIKNTMEGMFLGAAFDGLWTMTRGGLRQLKKMRGSGVNAVDVAKQGTVVNREVDFYDFVNDSVNDFPTEDTKARLGQYDPNTKAPISESPVQSASELPDLKLEPTWKDSVLRRADALEAEGVKDDIFPNHSEMLNSALREKLDPFRQKTRFKVYKNLVQEAVDPGQSISVADENLASSRYVHALKPSTKTSVIGALDTRLKQAEWLAAKDEDRAKIVLDRWENIERDVDSARLAATFYSDKADLKNLFDRPDVSDDEYFQEAIETYGMTEREAAEEVTIRNLGYNLDEEYIVARQYNKKWQELEDEKKELFKWIEERRLHEGLPKDYKNLKYSDLAPIFEENKEKLKLARRSIHRSEKFLSEIPEEYLQAFSFRLGPPMAEGADPSYRGVFIPWYQAVEVANNAVRTGVFDRTLIHEFWHALSINNFTDEELDLVYKAYSKEQKRQPIFKRLADNESKELEYLQTDKYAKVQNTEGLYDLISDSVEDLLQGLEGSGQLFSELNPNQTRVLASRFADKKDWITKILEKREGKEFAGPLEKLVGYTDKEYDSIFVEGGEIMWGKEVAEAYKNLSHKEKVMIFAGDAGFKRPLSRTPEQGEILPALLWANGITLGKSSVKELRDLTPKEIKNRYKVSYFGKKYRFSNIDEWVAETMTEAAMGRIKHLDSLAVPGSFKRLMQDVGYFLRELWLDVKEKFGFSEGPERKLYKRFLNGENLDYSVPKVTSPEEGRTGNPVLGWDTEGRHPVNLQTRLDKKLGIKSPYTDLLYSFNPDEWLTDKPKVKKDLADTAREKARKTKEAYDKTTKESMIQRMISKGTPREEAEEKVADLFEGTAFPVGIMRKDTERIRQQLGDEAADAYEEAWADEYGVEFDPSYGRNPTDLTDAEEAEQVAVDSSSNYTWDENQKKWIPNEVITDPESTGGKVYSKKQGKWVNPAELEEGEIEVESQYQKVDLRPHAREVEGSRIEADFNQKNSREVVDNISRRMLIDEYGEEEANRLINEQAREIGPETVTQQLAPANTAELRAKFEDEEFRKVLIEGSSLSPANFPKGLRPEVHLIDYGDPAEAAVKMRELAVVEAAIQAPISKRMRRLYGNDVRKRKDQAKATVRQLAADMGVTVEDAYNFLEVLDPAANKEGRVLHIPVRELMSAAEADIDGLDRMISRVTTMRAFMNEVIVGADAAILSLDDYLTKTSDDEISQEVLGKLLGPVMEAISITSMYRRTAAGAGRLLNSFRRDNMSEFLGHLNRMNQGGAASKAAAKHSSAAKASTEQLIKEWGGVRALRKKFNQLRHAGVLRKGNSVSLLHAIDKNPYSMRELGLNYAYSSLLSSPTSWTLNLASGVGHTAYGAIARGVGGLLTGQGPDHMINGFRGFLLSARDAVANAKDAFKLNRGVTLPRSLSMGEEAVNFSSQLDYVNRQRELQGESTLTAFEHYANSMPGSGLIKGAAKTFGAVMSTPMRVMNFGDELVKSLAAGASFETHAHASLDKIIRETKEVDINLAKELEENREIIVADIKKKAFLDGSIATEEAVFNSIVRKYDGPEYQDMSKAARDEQIEKDFIMSMQDQRTASIIGNYEADRIVKKMQEFADRSAFTTQFGTEGTRMDRALKNAERLRNSIPAFRLFVPFFRTPMNVYREGLRSFDLFSASVPVVEKLRAWNMNDAPLVPNSLKEHHTKFLRDYYSGDPVAKADAVGRVTLGVALGAAASSLFFSGRLTGRGPNDKNLKKEMESLGWSPYSVKVGDRFISYANVDPWGVQLRMMADFFEYSNYADQDEGEFEQVAMSVWTSVFHTMRDKTFLSGMFELLDMMDTEDSDVALGMANKFGNIITPQAGWAAVKAKDPVVRDANTLLEIMMKRTPGLSDKLPARRNMLGEKIIRPQSIATDEVGGFNNMWVPLTYRTVSSNSLDKEFMRLNHGFQPPARKLFGVDVTGYETRAGRNVYDRWSELQGNITIGKRNLRRALEETIRTESYRRMDDYEKIKRINRVISKYRRKAFVKVREEAPQFDLDWSLAREQNAAAESGELNYHYNLFNLENRTTSSF